MRTLRLIFGTLTIAMALVCGTTAKANSYSFDLNAEGGSFGTNPNYDGFIPIPQFNPVMGVLNSVQLIIRTSYAGSATVSGPAGAIGNYEAEETVIFRDSGDNIHVNTGNYWNGHFNLPDISTASGFSTPGSTTVSFSSPIVLSEFTGLGVFNLEKVGTQHTFVDNLNPYGVTASITSGNFNADINVTYNFSFRTARVPDTTSTVSLLAMGFGLIFFAKKAVRKEFKASRA